MALLASAASAAKYFVIEVKFFSGSLVFDEIGLREAEYTENQSGTSGFLVKSVSFEDRLINSLYFNISENRGYSIHVPYMKDAARIEIYNQLNSKVMELDVSSFADTCGNGICENHESFESCTKDCMSGSNDDFCDEIEDGICDPDCSAKTDADCGFSEPRENESFQETAQKPIAAGRNDGVKPMGKSSYLVWIVSALAAVMLLAFIFIKKRKEDQTLVSLERYISENIGRGFSWEQIKFALLREGYTEKELEKAIKSK